MGKFIQRNNLTLAVSAKYFSLFSYLILKIETNWMMQILQKISKKEVTNSYPFLKNDVIR